MSRLKQNRSFRIVAGVLLLLALWGSPHRQQTDDSACLPVVAGEHDASKHAFAPASPAHHDHCALCHWMRGLKPAFTVTLVDGIALRAGADVPSLPIAFRSGPSASRLPARAPPTPLL